MGEFFAMGKYGTYVWFAYGVTLIGLLLLFVWSWFGARSREAELEQVRKWARAERRTPSLAGSTNPAGSTSLTGSKGHAKPEGASAGAIHPAAIGGQASE